LVALTTKPGEKKSFPKDFPHLGRSQITNFFSHSPEFQRFDMSSVPIALWNLKVPSGGLRVPGYDDEDGSPLPYRITMAAIDSSVKSTKPSTLKCHRRVVTAIAEDSDDEDEEMDDAESTEEEFIICTLEAGKVNFAHQETRF